MSRSLPNASNNIVKGTKSLSHSLTSSHGKLFVAVPCLFLAGCGGLGGGDSSGSADPTLQLTTRARATHPTNVPIYARHISARDVTLYASAGYSAYHISLGEDQGRKFDLMPAGYKGSPNAARLLSYFTLSDLHITDKESPAEGPIFGWNAPYLTGGLLSSSYSPIMMTTTQVLDAAVQTINLQHSLTPFDFGIMLGDAANSNQGNELDWFIQVMDGGLITPSSGAHLGATTVDFQMPFTAEGLNPTIPWYAVIGNHDQYWMGIAYPSAKIRAAQVGSEVMNIGTSVFGASVTEQNGMYVGVLDGTSPTGEVIKAGPTSNFATAPTVAPDASRLSMTTANDSTTNYIQHFMASHSLPTGHGYASSPGGRTAACYTFEPKASLPIRVIVLDDTCKENTLNQGPLFYGNGWVDSARYTWLTTQLAQGQADGMLMIVACHIPMNPQRDLFNTAKSPQFYSGSFKNDAEMVATLQTYPNVILLIAGHRHINTVTPQPSTDPTHPEFGFWEVETPSLRDFPRQFRTFDILRNLDNSISIVTTDVEPQAPAGSLAARSLGYAIGAGKLFGNIGLSDASSHTYNAELVKYLTPAMQTKIASYGTALSRATVKKH